MTSYAWYNDRPGVQAHVAPELYEWVEALRKGRPGKASFSDVVIEIIDFANQEQFSIDRDGTPVWPAYWAEKFSQEQRRVLAEAEEAPPKGPSKKLMAYILPDLNEWLNFLERQQVKARQRASILRKILSFAKAAGFKPSSISPGPKSPEPQDDPPSLDPLTPAKLLGNLWTLGRKVVSLVSSQQKAEISRPALEDVRSPKAPSVGSSEQLCPPSVFEDRVGAPNRQEASFLNEERRESFLFSSTPTRSVLVSEGLYQQVFALQPGSHTFEEAIGHLLQELQLNAPSQLQTEAEKKKETCQHLPSSTDKNESDSEPDDIELSGESIQGVESLPPSSSNSDFNDVMEDLARLYDSESDELPQIEADSSGDAMEDLGWLLCSESDVSLMLEPARSEAKVISMRIEPSADAWCPQEPSLPIDMDDEEDSIWLDFMDSSDTDTGLLPPENSRPQLPPADRDW